MAAAGLSRAEVRALRRALGRTHFVDYRVEILDMRHQVINTIGDRVLSGSLSVDLRRDVPQTLRLTIDERVGGRLDGQTASDAPVTVDRLIRVWEIISGGGLDEPIEVPLFTGPLVQPVSDEGSSLVIEAQSKEALGMEEAWIPRTYSKGTRKTDVIKDLLSEAIGETPRYIDVPDRKCARLADDLTVNRRAQVWSTIKRLAKSMGYVTWHDGFGVVHVQPRPQRVTAIDSTGDGGTILEPVRRRTDTTELVNAVRVIGREPRGNQKRIEAKAVAPKRHPLSPQRLGLNGAERYFTRTIEDDSIRSEAEAQERADQALREGLRLAYDVEYAASPDPLIHPYQLRYVADGAGVEQKRVTRYEYPIGPGRMTVGYRDARAGHKIQRSK